MNNTAIGESLIQLDERGVMISSGMHTANLVCVSWVTIEITGVLRVNIIGPCVKECYYAEFTFIKVRLIHILT